MSTPSAHREHAPALAALLGSALLSGVVLLRRPLVNNDGVYYLLAAEAFARDGLEAARAFHPWPFFSILVAGLAGLLRTSTEVAAQVACAAFLAAASAAFVLVARRLGASRRVQWLAAAVVLAHPWLNQARDHVVRDFGAWAFALLALRALLGMEGLRAGDVARWAALGSAAVLFRPDAAALLLAGPLALLCRRPAEMNSAGRGGQGPPHPPLRRPLAFRRRIPLALGALAFALAVAAAALAAVAGLPGAFVSAGPFRRAAAALAGAFPLPYGREYAPVLLAIGLAALPVLKTLKTLGAAHALLAAAGSWRARPALPFHRAALAATLVAAALPLYVQAARLLFVESRYTVVATLVLALLAPFGAAWLIDRRPRLGAVAVAAALLATAAWSLPVRRETGAHVREAAAWVRANGGGARLHTNSLQLAYLSGAPVAWPLVGRAAVTTPLDGTLSRPGDLWAVRLSPADAPLRARLDALPSFAPRAVFEDGDGDAVRIYACTASAGCRSGSGE